MAQEMHIESRDKSTAISFSNFEKITFNGSTVTIAQTNGTASNYNMSDITRIHFGYYQSNIEETPQKETLRYLSAEEIEIRGISGTMVYLYDITGTQLLCTRLKEESIVINLAQHPKGIYIIRVGEETFKIVKK